MTLLRRLLAAIGRLLVPRLDLRAATHAIAGPAPAPAMPDPVLGEPGSSPAPQGAGRAVRATKVEPPAARFGRRPPRRTESEGWPHE